MQNNVDKKNIILVTSEFRKSGVFTVEKILVKEWKNSGYSISMITAGGRIISDSCNKANIVARDKESKSRFVRLFKRFTALKTFFENHRNAAIIALSLDSDCFAAIIGKFVPNRVVISERNDPEQYPDSRLYRKFRDFCFNFADVCIFQTEYAMKCFPDKVQKKGIIIPNPINPDIPVFENIDKEKKIVSAGRLKEQKNFPMLIHAFSKFVKKHPEYTLDIYGDGYLLNELIDLTEKLGLREKVNFNGFNTNIFPIIASASMFVMSSDYEGISNAMLESLAIGTPTICTDCPVGGAREMIENGLNGLLVPVGDSDALCEAMCKVAGDPEFAEMLGRNGQKIREKYPVEKIAQQWLDVMEM